MQQVLSKLFANIEKDLGAHRFCMLALEALQEALLQYKDTNRKQLKKNLLDIFKLLQGTKPKYAILLDAFYKILDAEAQASNKTFIKDVVKQIDLIHASYQLEKLEMVKTAQSMDVEGKNILIYDHSHSVQDVLNAFHQDGKKFTVVLAEQDIEKTGDNIEFFHNLAIDYKVVPSYMLSHVDKAIDMVFFGALTMQQHYHFVMDPGTKSLISHFYLEKKPIYVFLTTSKFSLWPLEKGVPHVYSKPQKRKHHTMSHIQFERLKFSHDRLSIDLVTKIITEKGIFNPEELKDVFDDLFKKRQKLRKLYLK